MSERLKYVSPEYQARLDALAETLCARFGKTALEDTVEFEPLVLFSDDMGTTTISAEMYERLNAPDDAN